MGFGYSRLTAILQHESFKKLNSKGCVTNVDSNICSVIITLRIVRARQPAFRNNLPELFNVSLRIKDRLLQIIVIIVGFSHKKYQLFFKNDGYHNSFLNSVIKYHIL